MTKKESDIVDITENQVRKFAQEWKKNPYLWDTEADVHGELYVRIKKALRKGGFGKIKGHYKAYMDYDAWFDRIYCEPLTYIEGWGRCQSDIVIYEKLTFKDDNKKKNEPMLWVCEIKYKSQWGGDPSGKNRLDDKEKLKQLLRQRTNPKIHGTKRACFLDFVRDEKEASFKIVPITL